MNLHPFAVKPWVEAASLEVHPLLEGVTSRLDSGEIRRKAALVNIRQMHAHMTLYMDGSAFGGTRMVGRG